MRSLVPTALLGSFLLVTSAQAQSLAEHAAAASGATIGTAAGKPLSNAITKIFGKTDAATQKAASPKADTKTPAKPKAESTAPAESTPTAAAQASGSSLPSAGESTPSRHGGFSRRSTSDEYASVNPPVVAYVEPPRKEPTAEALAAIQVGATTQELVSALGQPESKVTIPDDGHLVEICQYWAKGKQLGTVRLDNGQVVNVESRTQD